jgi:hypothetical protein
MVQMLTFGGGNQHADRPISGSSERRHCAHGQQREGVLSGLGIPAVYAGGISEPAVAPQPAPAPEVVLRIRTTSASRIGVLADYKVFEANG